MNLINYEFFDLAVSPTLIHPYPGPSVCMARFPCHKSCQVGTGDPGRGGLTHKYCVVRVLSGTALLLTGAKWKDREGCERCTVAFDLTGNN